MSEAALQPCGTKAAYQRHLRRGEDPCDPCREANSQHRRSYFDGTRDRNRIYQQAVRNANKRLQERYPATWRELLAEERAKLDDETPESSS